MVAEGRVQSFQPRLEMASAAQFQMLAKSLVIVESGGGHLMTVGDFRLVFFQGEKPLAEIEIVGNRLLRWPAKWKDDAHLADPPALAGFLKSAGFPGLADALEQAVARAVKAREAHAAWAATWEAATPAGLAPLVNQLSGQVPKKDPTAIGKALSLLQSQYPSINDGVLALFAWYGHRSGPWSGYPAFEIAPETLLESFSPDQLVTALESRESSLTDQHLEGAARFVSRWVHESRRETQKLLIDRFQRSPVRRRLIEFVHALNDDWKIRAIDHAFSTHGPGESPRQKQFYPAQSTEKGSPAGPVSKKTSLGLRLWRRLFDRHKGRLG
jgi:hypothetical protein